jgi:hypothetical protein
MTYPVVIFILNGNGYSGRILYVIIFCEDSFIPLPLLTYYHTLHSSNLFFAFFRLTYSTSPGCSDRAVGWPSVEHR